VSLLLYMPEERSKIASLTREIGAEFKQMEALVSTAEKVSSKDAHGRSMFFHFPLSFLVPDPSRAPLYQFLLLLMSSDKMAWWLN